MYRWKNISRYLSKFIKNKENPMKYNMNTDLRSLVKKPSKIPGVQAPPSQADQPISQRGTDDPSFELLRQ